jgi:hypothetical protein
MKMLEPVRTVRGAQSRALAADGADKIPAEAAAHKCQHWR